MQKKEVAQKGMSMYGSYKNKKEHKRFDDNIEVLYNRSQADRINMGSMRISLSDCFTRLQKLERYSIPNIKKLYDY